MDQRRPTPRQIIIKMARSKDKERTIKAPREKQVSTNKGAPIRLSSDFSTETIQDRREWYEICKVMKCKDLQTRLLYPEVYHLKLTGIRNFPHNVKLKDFVNTKPVLQQMLKGLL